jgi:alkylhydroperoxidase family enzyme
LAKREGLSEAAIDRIGDYEDAEFPDRTKAALRFADRFAEDHRSIDDAFMAGLRGHFSDPELVELGLAVGTFVSLGRLIHVFDLHYGAAPDPA